MNKKILVTGADGFLGSHVVRRALKAGYSVRAFIQTGRHLDVLDGLPIEKFEGELLIREDIHNALDGCDMVIHTAASTAVWPSKAKWIWDINYQAVVDLADEVQLQGIRRFVYIGSACSFGYGTKAHPGDENCPYKGKGFGLDYMDSKVTAQEYLLQEHAKSSLPVVIINPTYMIGENDSKPGSGKMVVAVVNKNLPGFTSGGKSIVYVGDAAQAAVNAIQMGTLGECYIAGGENLSYKEFFTLIAEAAEIPKLRLSIPSFLMVFAGYVMETLSKITKTPPLITTAMGKMAGDGHYYSSRKAFEELKMPRTSAKIAIEKAIKYFQEVDDI